VLGHVDLVITHGGHGTVTRSLAAGVPVMVVPVSRDQPDNAARVLYHGVGIKVSKRSSPDKFASAVRSAMVDDAMRSRARRMADRLAPDLGAPKAVAALEELAASDHRRATRR
jgi:UDP:flavonoid glycosyltransferase YjiC (YdhE family)